ncbi:TPA: phage repressor protein/antirepressor Ant [Streptococcus pyogenes]|uniref:phage repressor protein/antirepressor Ant n=4 Tax=Streptococcus pyogenes TaxID=1314 RepID=UPI00000D984F|nr:phage repressor protein/antirepressor Ant [Streptococcus pyogenes]ERL08081.1 antirepressor protein KilAC domain protein [Streptococcus pyogenes GA06023]ESA53818.1 antirepressor protein KilAC domain protein [Streptococcus pyogenes GA40468]QBX19701.1 antirepressor protein [Streptococcus phage Javan493]QBX30051.1 antirepressor protein [Streptococcus phage Javan522]HEP6170885.1 phage repressor protein/antirepressor Ant [Streptococcus pyogenes ABC020030174]HEP6198642.1 phage repressor protein/a
MQEIFNFKGQEVRTVTIDDEPYFVGKDVAEILGYAKARNAIASHVDDEDKKDAPIQGTLGGTQTMTIINESGLYSLILSSKLPQAKEFKRWVTSEVLPTIRKHGMYATDELLDNPDFAIATLQKLKEEREAKKLLEAQIEADRPKVLFADAVSASHTSILVGELAKLLKQNGVNIGATRLFTWLRKHGYLIKRNGRDWNMPTQKSVELGLIRVKETSITHSDGHITVSKTPLVTGKGQQYFINKFLNQEYLPV